MEGKVAEAIVENGFSDGNITKGLAVLGGIVVAGALIKASIGAWKRFKARPVQ